MEIVRDPRKILTDVCTDESVYAPQTVRFVADRSISILAEYLYYARTKNGVFKWTTMEDIVQNNFYGNFCITCKLRLKSRKNEELRRTEGSRSAQA